MNTAKDLTLKLAHEDYARLETKAKSLGLQPGILAQRLLHESLAEPRPDPRVALDALARLRRGLPRVDAAEIVRAGREQLAERELK